jgi:hypothetical protein
MRMIWESAIRAGDFAGFVPASRGAHCRPLHPRLASLCFLETETITDSRADRRPPAGLSDRDRQRPPTGLRPLPTGAARHGAGNHKNHMEMFPFVTIINSWRNFPDGVAVI